MFSTAGEKGFGHLPHPSPCLHRQALLKEREQVVGMAISKVFRPRKAFISMISKQWITMGTSFPTRNGNITKVMLIIPLSQER